MDGSAIGDGVGDGGGERAAARGGARIRFPEVDGLRGIALAAIVAYQLFRFSGLPAYAPAPIARVFTDAGQGLALFLVLSAFSLAYPVFAAIAADGCARFDVGRYASGRALRLYPAYLAVLVLATLLRPLGILFGFPALAHAAPAIDFVGFVRAAVFADGGLGNDGMRAAGLFVVAYVLLPFLLALWLRSPRLALFLAIAATLVDTLTRAHGAGLALLVPLTLGIAAADLRVRDHRSQRFGPAVAAAAAALAFVLEPHVAQLPGALAVPNALRIDPFWSLAFGGILVAAAAVPLLRRILGFVAIRTAAGPAYAVSLVVMPIADFAARQLPPGLGTLQAASVTLGSALAVGLVLWQCVDRRFARAGIRERLAVRPGNLLDRALARVRLASVVFAPPQPPAAVPDESIIEDEPRPVEPPRRRPGDLAVLSTRTGSPEDLAAEISETKRRLTDRATPPTETLPSVPALAEARVDPRPQREAPALTPPPPPAVVAVEPLVEAVPTPIPASMPAPAAVTAEPEPVPVPVPALGLEPEVVTEFSPPAFEPAPAVAPVAHAPAAPEAIEAEPDTAGTLARLVHIVETTEAEFAEPAPVPVAVRPAIKMRIGPPRS